MAQSKSQTNRLSAIMGSCVAPSVLERAGMATKEGLDAFLRSETFEILSDPRTGMWHLSPTTLAEILKHELTFGTLDTPEEQS